jgi:hypothetical protein
VTFRLVDPVECVAPKPPLVVSPKQGWVTVDAPLRPRAYPYDTPAPPTCPAAVTGAT